MIIVKLNVTKLLKQHFFQGKQGTYVDLCLFDKPDNFGNAGFVKQDLPRELRDAGQSGPIVGNWKEVGKKVAPAPKKEPPAQRPKPPADPDLDAVPDEPLPF